MQPTTITILAPTEDAVDLLLELNQTPGIEAKFAEQEPIFDEKKTHPLYSLEYATLAQLVVSGIGLLGGLTTLTTALINYKTAKLSRGKREGKSAAIVIINGKELEITDSDTAASVEEKLRGCAAAKEEENA